MDFVVPYDQINVTPPGPWTNANPSSGVQGSIVNAAVFPAVQNEILAVQDAAGETRNASDNQQMLKAVRSGLLTYYAETGTSDALVITPSVPYTALPAGTEFAILKGASANATTTPTLAVNGLVQTIVKEDGSPLAVGDLPGGALFSVRSDGSKMRMVGLRKSDAPAQYVPIVHRGDDTSGNPNTITSSVYPPTSAYATDDQYLIGVANACTGPARAYLYTGDTTGRPVVRSDGSALEAGDWAVGDRLLLADDGTSLRLVGLTLPQILSEIITANPSISPPRNIVSQSTAGTYSFTVPANVTWLLVTVVGAGGGGAGGGGSTSWSGGGGGSGGTAISWVAVTPGQVITYIVGAGGFGGGTGDGNTGGAGGTSSFGASISASGGGGATGGTSTCAGGGAGEGSGGQINLPGSVGGDGNNIVLNIQGGQGGASSQGGGGRTATTGGFPGEAPGSGGGGTWLSGASGHNGGQGADGLVEIQY